MSNEILKKATESLEVGSLLQRFVPLERYSHYQREYNWEFLMPGTMGGIPGFLVSKYCQSVKFGQYTISEIIEFRKASKKEFFAGLQDLGPVTSTFLCPVPNLVSGYFSAWKLMTISDKGLYGLKNEYKRSLYVLLYDTTGIRTHKIKLKGCWPTAFPSYDLKYEAENVVKFEVDFKFDDLEISGVGLDVAGVAAQIGIHI